MASCLVKLEAIKENGLSIEQADVAQDQIAVTPAHLAGRLPPIEKLRMYRKGPSKMSFSDFARLSDQQAMRLGALDH